MLAEAMSPSQIVHQYEARGKRDNFAWIVVPKAQAKGPWHANENADPSLEYPKPHWFGNSAPKEMS